MTVVWGTVKYTYLHIKYLHYLDLLVPWVLVTKVLPRLRMLNMAGALTSYQSFLEKGSTLHDSNKKKYTVHWSAQTKIQTGLYSRLASRLAASKPAKHALRGTLKRASMLTERIYF